MKDLISIIVPVYNVEKYVTRCLESIARQDYRNIEIIIVDDGSNDRSGEICDEFEKEEKRAKVFHKKNGGLSDARNFGINKARGEWIIFVDSDDYVNKKYISKMYNALKSENIDIVVCGYNDEIPQKMVLSGEEATIRLLTKQENIDIVAWNKLYKKKLFVNNEIFFPKGKIHEDTLTTYKILSKARKVAYVPEALYRYVQREDSITKEEDVEERLRARELAAREAVDYFRDNDKEKEAAMVALLLAKYASLDNAIAGRIEKRQGELARKWIVGHKEEFKNNKYVGMKLRIYITTSVLFGGIIYKLFRKIVHE